MTLQELRALLETAHNERAAIYQAAEARFADPEDSTEVRGAFLVDDEGNPTGVRDEHAGLTETEVERLAELDNEDAVLSTRIERAERAEQAFDAGQGVRTAHFQVRRGDTDDPHDESRAAAAQTGELRSMLETALERSRVDDTASHEIMRTLDNVRADNPRHERALLQFGLTTSADAYRSAFSKVLTNRSYLLTEQERRMLERAEETRATITIATGLSFPIDIDPSFIHTGTQAVHPWRQLATVKSGTENTHKANVFGAASFAMRADGAEVASDGTPADTAVSMTAQTLSGVMTYTMAAGADMDGLVTELGMAAADAIGVVESDQFTNGTGTAPEVEGLLDGTTVTRVTTAAIDTLKEVDLMTAYNALGTRYRRRATWQSSVPGHNDLRLLENTAGFRVGVAATVADGAAGELLGQPWYENSELPGPSAATVWTTDDVPVIVGDIAQAYRIYDVIGSATVEFIPHMFGTTANLPNGTRGLFVNKRLAAGITDAAAARCIKIG